MKAIICGAGIDGITAAWWLNRAGWEVVLIGRAQHLNTKGYPIDFLHSRSDILDRMGLLTKLGALRSHIARIAWMNIEEKEVAELNYFRLEGIFGQNPFILSHGDISRTLFDNLPPEVKRRLGCCIRNIRQAADCVMIELTDGSSERADVLIGADGVRSNVRDLIFGAQQRFYTYLGYWTAGFVLHDNLFARKLGGDLKLMCAPGRIVGLCPLPSGRVSVSFAYETSGSVIELRHAYEDFGWLIPHVLNSAPALADMRCERVLQVNLPRWSTGRVTLLGDACHAVSAPVAQEATLAISNAFVLAEALCREKNVSTALRFYEDQLKPALDRKQERGRRMKKWVVPRTDAQILMRNMALNLANQRGTGWMIKGIAASRLGYLA